MSGENASDRVVPFSGGATGPVEAPPPDEGTVGLVKKLRALLQRAQLRGRGDFDRACMLIAGDRNTTMERYALAFFQGAQIFSRRRMTFFNDKAQSLSDDEMWAARILQALHDEDHASARYLMALRIEPEGRRRLMFLAQGLADHLWATPREVSDG